MANRCRSRDTEIHSATW